MNAPRPGSELTEGELADGCRRGDRPSQHELYARTSERIYHLLLKMSGNPDDAFDLAQETYLRAFTRIQQFDGRSSLFTWLYRIAVNEALQFARRAATLRTNLERSIRIPASESNNGRATAGIDVGEALAAVSPEDRAILFLRYQEGLDYQAIADVTGCPAGTVASRLNRARERIKELLKRSYDPAEENAASVHPMIKGFYAVEEPEGGVRPQAGRTGAQSQ